MSAGKFLRQTMLIPGSIRQVLFHFDLPRFFIGLLYIIWRDRSALTMVDQSKIIATGSKETIIWLIIEAYVLS